MDYSPPGSSVHGISQARKLKWVAMIPPGDLPNPGIEPASPTTPVLQVDSLLLSRQESPFSYDLILDSVAQLVKNPPAVQKTWVRSLGWEDPLEKGKATHSNILAWRIPWAIQSMGLQRIWHN